MATLKKGIRGRIWKEKEWNGKSCQYFLTYMCTNLIQLNKWKDTLLTAFFSACILNYYWLWCRNHSCSVYYWHKLHCIYQISSTKIWWPKISEQASGLLTCIWNTPVWKLAKAQSTFSKVWWFSSITLYEYYNWTLTYTIN